MAKRVSVDRWLFTVTMLLVFVGLVMVFSASAVMARERFGSPYAFLLKQLIWAAAGLVAMVAAMRVDYRRYKHPALVCSLLGITTLLLISVFFWIARITPTGGYTPEDCHFSLPSWLSRC
jgi:cell division protein FtsW